MNIEKLRIKREKIDDKIRQAERRQRERKERHLLTLARKFQLLEMDPAELESALARISVVATESETTSDTVAPGLVTRTPARDQPETALETPKKRWSAP